jgi:predicted transcriptional regulator YdeE
MENKDLKQANEFIDSLEVPEDKKDWMKQYAANHIEYEKNPPREVKKIDEPKKEFVHFEVHSAMKDFWKTKTVNNNEAH